MDRRGLAGRHAQRGAERRIGTGDNNTAVDWPWTQGTATWGTTNAGLTLPWTTSTPLAVTPASVALTQGEFVGYLKFTTAASSVRLTTTASAYTGQSAVFDVLARARRH